MKNDTTIVWYLISQDLNKIEVFFVCLQNSYFFVTLDGGYIVLQGENNGTMISEKSKVKVFPKVSFLVTS